MPLIQNCTNNATSLKDFFSESRITATLSFGSTNWLFVLRISFYLPLSLFIFNLPTAPKIKPEERQAKRHVDEEDSPEYRIGISGQNRKAILIKKSGVYSLILDSQLPKAKEFRHWVTSEVLAKIDETGSYSVSQKKKKELPPLLRCNRRAAPPREFRSTCSTFTQRISPDHSSRGFKISLSIRSSKTTRSKKLFSRKNERFKIQSENAPRQFQSQYNFLRRFLSKIAGRRRERKCQW